MGCQSLPAQRPQEKQAAAVLLCATDRNAFGTRVCIAEEVLTGLPITGKKNQTEIPFPFLCNEFVLNCIVRCSLNFANVKKEKLHKLHYQNTSYFIHFICYFF